MFTELCGKRLLILGGSLWKEEIKKFCSESNVTIVAAGYDPHAGICDIADEYYDINSTDGKAIKKLIAEKQIDGVYMGGNEPVITVACEYINEMNLPCYCNKTQWNALQNKQQFKELCKQFGLPVVKRLVPEKVCDSDFPIITKPADGYGSNGFAVCNNYEELKRGYVSACDNSSSGKAIIEHFVPNDGIVVFYTITEGKLVFATLEDKYPVYFKQYGTYVGGLFDFESELVDEFRSLFEDKIQQLISYLNIREGNFWIEVFHGDGKYYFNEVGFRYGGSGSLYPVDYFSGINQVAADIYYALTGKSKIEGFTPIYGENIPHGQKYAIYPVFLRSGTIETIKGNEKLMGNPNILNILAMKKEGYTIPDNGSFGQVLELVHFIYRDLKELKTTLSAIHRELIVKDIHGEDMILQLLDIHSFELRKKG